MIIGALILDIMMTFTILVTLTIPLLLALVGVIKIFFPQRQRNESIQNKPPMWMLYIKLLEVNIYRFTSVIAACGYK